METVTWRRVQYSGPAGQTSKRADPQWLLFNPTEKIDRRIASALRERGGKVTIIEKAAKYKTFADGRIALDPSREADVARACETVVKALPKRQRLQVVYFCEPTPARKPELVEARYRKDIDDKLNTPIVLMRSLMQVRQARQYYHHVRYPLGAGSFRR